MQTPGQDSAPVGIPILGADGYTPADVYDAIRAGARCVRFEYVTSFGLATVRQQSRVYLTDDWQERYLRGFLYTARSMLLGPWAVPWGPLWCAWAAWVNLSGGVDATHEVLHWLRWYCPEPVESTPAAEGHRP